jgi:diguanylate cyclase (GGDEF)-like protein
MLHIMSMRVRLSTLLVAESLDTQKACMRDATIDALTGLHNRRWLDDMFEQELVHSRREGLPLCLLMLDVDHFKSYNDRYGHVAGDCVLTGVAEGLRGALRPNDMLARYGGEEFALLLPQTQESDALALAERLRRIVAEVRVQDANGGWLPKVTISVGVSAGGRQDLASLIADADAALYRAKKAGRDRVSL